ncbi:MAG TPA: hypothetical protein VL551_21990 [Actinospica sp.]|nr:hypothetical protein [Actinospica sp.]
MSLILIGGAILLFLWLRARWHGRRYGQALSLTTMHRSRRGQMRAAQRSRMLAKATMAERAAALFWRAAVLCVVLLIIRVYLAVGASR